MASLSNILQNLAQAVGNDIKGLKTSLGNIEARINNSDINKNNVNSFPNNQTPNTDNITNISRTGKTKIVTKYIRNFDNVIIDVIQEEVPL